MNDDWTGLFLGSGVTMARAGPGGAILAYALMGTVISAIISCLGEMTALMPVNAPVMEFPRRFLDRGIGFAVAWIYWYVSGTMKPSWNFLMMTNFLSFSYAVSAGEELVAVTRCIQFEYDDGRTYLRWALGNQIDPAVYVYFL